MDHLLTGAQASTAPLYSGGVQLPIEAQKSPLGHSISQASAGVRAENPLLWHATYWLCILVLGILRGENESLMSHMITMEHEKIPDRKFRHSLQALWAKFQARNKEEFKRICEEWTLEHSGVKPYLEDLDRLKINNMQSAAVKLYLDIDRLMISNTQPARVSEPKTAFDDLDELLIKLQEEGLAGDQGEQDLDTSESEYFSNDGCDSVG